MFRRARYQNGSLQLVKRKNGSDTWIFRWYETDATGAKRYRKVVLGTTDDYATESAAETAAAALRLKINQEAPRTTVQPIAVRDLIAHYKETELNLETVADDPDVEKAHSTKKAYRTFLDRWIQPRWGEARIKDVRTIAVEDWLKRLTLKDGERMAKGTKAKIRNIMHALFNHAIRHEWLAQHANPISKVRQSAKRERVPEILEITEFQLLLKQLGMRERTLVVLDATTGLRRSELLALKWCDIDFESFTIDVTRSIVNGVVGSCKTEASRKPVPLEPGVADDIRLWKQTTPYNRPEDWVFASVRKKGKKPVWPDMLLRKYVQPAAERAGISKRIGWHTFRHTYSTLLKANGEDVKVVQELLRHANIKITMDTYTQALSPAKREAQSRVVTMILPKRKDGKAAAGER